MDNVTLAQFWDMLEEHDWYHEMSDDRRVDERGSADWRRIEKIADGKPEFQAMMKAFTAHYYSGAPFRKEQQPKPHRPADE